MFSAPRFKACKRSQPADKLNECVRDSLQKAVPELVKGETCKHFKNRDEV